MSAELERGVSPPSRLAPLAATIIPALALAYPILIWPLLYATPVDQVSEFAPVSAEVQSYFLTQLYFPPLFGAAALAWLSAGGAAPRALKPFLLLLGLFGVVCAASVLWSIEPGITIRRVLLQMTIVGAIVLAGISAPDPSRIVRAIFWLLLAVLAVNLFAVLTRNPGPLGYEGIYPQKNGLGAVAALSILFMLHELFGPGRARRIAAAAGLAAAVALLVLSRSKTSLALAVFIPPAAIALVAICRWLRLSAGLVIGIAVTGALLLYELVVQLYSLDRFDVAGALTGNPTLTSRSVIWNFAGRMIGERPWFGYGFETFWQIGPEAPSFRQAPDFVASMPDAHNGYFDILLQVGITGFAVFVPILLAAFHIAGRAAQRDFRLGWLSLALLSFIALHNISETSWFRGFSELSMTFLTAVLVAAMTQSRRLPA